MELQLKHLSSYLPYKTQIKTRYEIISDGISSPF